MISSVELYGDSLEAREQVDSEQGGEIRIVLTAGQDLVHPDINQDLTDEELLEALDTVIETVLEKEGVAISYQKIFKVTESDESGRREQDNVFFLRCSEVSHLEVKLYFNLLRKQGNVVLKSGRRVFVKPHYSTYAAI